MLIGVWKIKVNNAYPSFADRLRLSICSLILSPKSSLLIEVAVFLFEICALRKVERALI